ncbi:phage holin family protein [Pseudarthrobacter sp. NS4]|uniref:phage holin family protein n=1 Tax=Pseudarthrobacter sp. NS4 TaxID=2973976 RepID=UPI002163A0A8|nr:phage holin family protein [Pseudarthrobacter sp. NS4]
MSSQIPEPPPTPAHAKADTNSLGELLGDVTRDLSTLMRQELELAKAEAKQSATKAGKGGGMLAGAGVAGHFVLVFLSIALWYALGQLMGLGWSAVVVAVIWGIIAAILAAVGRKELKKIKGMPQTVETVQEIPPTLKPNGGH